MSCEVVGSSAESETSDRIRQPESDVDVELD
jgi:hypothetical protein